MFVQQQPSLYFLLHCESGNWLQLFLLPLRGTHFCLKESRTGGARAGGTCDCWVSVCVRERQADASGSEPRQYCLLGPGASLLIFIGALSGPQLHTHSRHTRPFCMYMWKNHSCFCSLKSSPILDKAKILLVMQ